MRNAGQRLIDCQRAQGTLLGCGVDPHYDPPVGINEEVYCRYATSDLMDRLRPLVRESIATRLAKGVHEETLVKFLAGVAGYFRLLHETAWRAGLRVFKPQSAFFERLKQFGPFVELLVLERLHELAGTDRESIFLVSDCKKEDLALTMRAYFDARLPGSDMEIIPGLPGQFDYDAMTVTSWMGLADVLSPGISYFKVGKGAVVVTRSSNPAGTGLQDMIPQPNTRVTLSEKQEPHRLTEHHLNAVRDLVERDPMAHEVLLWQTEKFCKEHGLIQDGVSPILSVMGATTLMDRAFRRIRQSGIALIPGFGGQKGNHANVMSLFWEDGPNAGLGGICASSREQDFAWMTEYGGDGNPDPANFPGHVMRSIDNYRVQEHEAFEIAKRDYPFAA